MSDPSFAFPPVSLSCSIDSPALYFRQTKAEFKYEIFDFKDLLYCKFGYGCWSGRRDLYIEILGVIAGKMNMVASLSLVDYYDDIISYSTLEQAAEIYIYLVTDQDAGWMHWYKQFRDIFECKSLSRSLCK